MRILMVAQFFAPVIGGEERMVEAMSVALARRGHDVMVATLQLDGLPARESYRGVEIRRIQSTAQHLSAVYAESARPHALPAPDPGALRGLLRLIDGFRPDVIHGHNWLVNSLLPSKSKRHGGAPIVLSLHDFSLVCATKRLMRDGTPCEGPSTGKCISCAAQHYGSLKGAPTAVGVRVMDGVARANVDLFLPVSEAVERHCGLRDDPRSIVLPNFVPDDLAREAGDGRVDGLPKGPYLLFAGDATADKGIEILLDAYARLRDAPPLVLIGRADSPRLLDPPPNVRVLGPRPHHEVLIAMRRALALVVPSTWREPFGLVALEATALGVPVIAAAHGGLTDIVVHGETGLLVLPGDVHELEVAMHRLLSGPQLRADMGTAAHRHAASFAESVIVPRLERHYERLIGDHPRGGDGGRVRAVAAPAPAVLSVATSGPAARDDTSGWYMAADDVSGHGHSDGYGASATMTLPVGAALQSDGAAAATLELTPHPSVPEVEPPAPAGVRPPARRPGWGAFPLLTLTCAIGLALISAADWMSRTGRPGGQAVLWGGLVLIVVPVVARLFRGGASRNERAGIVVLVGVALYLVKVLRDPFAFTYGDELLHQYNVQHILSSGALFGSNPILPVTAGFPGLEGATAALCSLTGLSTYAGGLIVVGAARVVLMLAIFLLIERVTGSSRVGALAAVAYTAAPNYLFFVSQFSYESLALPLAVLASYAAVRGAARRAAPSWRWTALALLLAGAVVVTHHLTSYALVAFLALVCLVPMRPWGRRPWLAAIATAAAAGAWLQFVALQTVGYLWPIFHGAVVASYRTVIGTAAPRRLFQTSTGTAGSPEWEHLVGIGATAIVIVAVPIGVVLMWRRSRGTPAGVVLALAGIGYVASLGLRLVPAAWETGARASEFLFIGVAMLVGLTAVWAGARSSRGGRTIALVVGCVLAAVLFAGGVVGGSSPERRMAQTYRVAADGTTLDPPAAALASWMDAHLPGAKLVGNDGTAERVLVGTAGRVDVATGSDPPLSRTDPPNRAVLAGPKVLKWHMGLLDGLGIGYAAIDRRLVTNDVIAGFFFPRPDVPPDELTDDTVRTKFERLGADRLWDSGDLRLDSLKGVDRDAAADQ